MYQEVISIIKQKKNIVALVVGSLILFFLFRLTPVFDIVTTSLRLPGLALGRKVSIVFEYTLGTFGRGSITEDIIPIMLSILTTLNVILFVRYAKRQRKIFSKRSLAASISGILLGLFGVGCLSCGALVLAPLLTFVGLGGSVGFCTQHAVAISYLGLGFVIASIGYLLYRLSRPLVC